MKHNVELTPYYARDRRVYNGASCSGMNREQEHLAALSRRMRKADPTAHCTDFYQDGWIVWITPDPNRAPRELTGNGHWDKQSAIIEAIKVLENGT